MQFTLQNFPQCLSYIPTRCQFHQHYTREFFVRKFIQSQNVSRKLAFVRKIHAFNVDEIDYRCQVSISPTCLQKTFTCAIRQSHHRCLFALLGSPNAKAACKTLVKLTQCVSRTWTFLTLFTDSFGFPIQFFLHQLQLQNTAHLKIGQK